MADQNESMCVAECVPNGADGGYDFKFVDTLPDDVICQICQYPSREPYLSVCCGHIFCKSCLEKYIASSSFREVRQVCPVCRSTDFKSFPNKQIDRKVRSLHVLCIHYQKGCQWRGEVNAISKHQNVDCQFQEIFCPKNCGKLVPRLKMPNHVENECECRIVQCEYCQLRAEHCYINSKHLSDCPKLRVACPNKCSANSILRKNLSAHEKVCPLVLVKCKYYEVGCTTMMFRKEEKIHIKANDKHHLQLFINQHDIMKSQLAEKEHQLAMKDDQLLKANSELSQMEGMLAKTNHELAMVRSQVNAKQVLADSARKELIDNQLKLASAKQELTSHKQKLVKAEKMLTITQRELTSNKRKLCSTQQSLDIAQNELVVSRQKLARTQRLLDNKQRELVDTELKLASTQQNLNDSLVRIKKNTKQNFQSKIDTGYKFIDEVVIGVEMSEIAILLCNIIMALFAGYKTVQDPVPGILKAPLGLVSGILFFLVYIYLYFVIKALLVFFAWMHPKLIQIYVKAKEHIISRLQNNGSTKAASSFQFCFFCLPSNAAEKMKQIMKDAN